LHTLSCIIAKNEILNEKIALGLSGGDYRPLLHAIILTNIIDYKLNLQEAIEKPRFLWNGYKDLRIEEGYDIEGLKKKGHNVKVLKYPSRTGVAHALSSSSIITLAYDIRGDSLAIGY
jgi:gamma-glutamyltranspeptidase/glutathione hydrolase